MFSMTPKRFNRGVGLCFAWRLLDLSALRYLEAEGDLVDRGNDTSSFLTCCIFSMILEAEGVFGVTDNDASSFFSELTGVVFCGYLANY